MTQLPTYPQSPEQQQEIMEQMYLLVGKQVQSYHKHRHMGNNSSVPMELALDLAASIEYTIHQAGGALPHQNLEEALKTGQAILAEKACKAKSMLDLVSGTAPNWQTECRWEALQYLRDYLSRYDHLHLAHKEADELFYPVLISPPEGIQGIDSCLFYLNILWIENQIMASFPEEALNQLWDRLPTDTLNQCERLLMNAIGKILIKARLDSLTFETKERLELKDVVTEATGETWREAAKMLCQQLNLIDTNAQRYVAAIIPQTNSSTAGNNDFKCLNNLFL